MPYTLWSRGRLLGETELAYRQAMPGLRAGDFFPNELGDRLMPVIDGMRPVLYALDDVHTEFRRANPSAPYLDDYPPAIKRTPEYADVMSTADEIESLRLELRDPDGAVVETEDIWIQDTHRLLALAAAAQDPFDNSFDDPFDDEDMTDEMRASIEHDVEIMNEHFDELERQADRESWTSGEPGKPWSPDEGDWDEEGGKPWVPEKEYPRYQIFVRFPGFQPFAKSGSPTE
jgi:hypothetical protein